MDIQNVMTELKSKFGDKFDVSAVTEHLKGIDLNNFSMSEIVEKVKNAGFLKDLDGDGKEEGIIEEIKGKFSGLFGK